MEQFNADRLKSLAFQSIIQQGKGSELDRYIYQQGSGLGSFFGGLFRHALPFIGKAIKGIGRVAKPHLIAAGKDLVNEGAKRGVEELTKLGKRKKNRKTVHSEHTTKKGRWQNL